MTEPDEIARHQEIEERNRKLDQAAFGREVDEFIERDTIGQYLINRAKQDLAEVVDKFLCANPADAQTIASLQLDARVAQRMRDWLREAIENGKQAEILLQQERDEHGV